MLPEYKKKQKEIEEQNNNIDALTQRVSKNETDINILKNTKVLKTIQRVDAPKRANIASSTAFSKVATIKNESEANVTRHAIIMANIKFDKNNVGDRGIEIANNDLSKDFASSVTKSSNDNSTRLNVVYLARFAQGEEFSIAIFQNSGSTLNYELEVKTLFFDNL